MEGTGPTTAGRVIAVLHARQYVVFFAIALYTLDFAAATLSSWLYRGGSVGHVLETQWGPLAEAVAGRSLAIAAVFVVFIALSTWLSAGYIRSLTGTFHLGAATGGQFWRLLGFELLFAAANAGIGGVVVVAGAESGLASVAMLVSLLFSVVIVYGDYIVVLAGAGPIEAILLSWKTVRATLGAAVAVVVLVTLTGIAWSLLTIGLQTETLAQAAPLVLIRCVLFGMVRFVSDVVLIMLYVTTVESGRLEKRQRPAA